VNAHQGFEVWRDPGKGPPRAKGGLRFNSSGVKWLSGTQSLDLAPAMDRIPLGAAMGSATLELGVFPTTPARSHGHIPFQRSQSSPSSATATQEASASEIGRSPRLKP